MSEAALVGILGLARSGRAAAQLARARGLRVYATDSGDDPTLQTAAEEIRRAGGEVLLGSHDVVRLQSCDLLVVSPGIPPDAPVLTDQRLQRIPRLSELEFAFGWLRSPVIAVTGTNGKTTTTALTAHLLASGGLSAVAAGNIGLALSEVALQEPPPRWVVAETSSFQLADVDRFAPRVGVVTNLTPDHLDRYPSAAAYYADKAKLFRRASADSVWVLNGEDPNVRALLGDAPGHRYYFRVRTPLAPGEEGGYVDQGRHLVLRMDGQDHALLHTAELKLLGRHNQANSLAAAVAATVAGVDPDLLAVGLRSFTPLEHRLQPVVEVDGVQWINDSKATNVAATMVAVESMQRPTILLLGGRHKGEPYTALLPALRGQVRMVVAYGEARDCIAHDLADQIPVINVSGDLAAVVGSARSLARPGDAVLLSPACSSFDMFRNYEERGRLFEQLAKRSREVSGG